MSGKDQKNIRVLLLGDIVGAPGRAMFQKHSASLRKTYKADAIIVNGENSFKGKGITPRVVKFFRTHGADLITTGNHIWFNREIYTYLADHDDVLRPANFPSKCPGRGVTTFLVGDVVVGVINVQGRTFMREFLDSPFAAVDSCLTYLKDKTATIIVDVHAEATSEKMALAYYLDGRVSAVVGTHTHVQTADERVLPKGTAYISDLGMAGALNSIIGGQQGAIIKKLLNQMPHKFVVDHTGPFFMTGVCIQIDTRTGEAITIERIRIDDADLQVDEEE
jgi:2',3'-cyclic-nucleotide 2'-phosphodiesterase